MMVRSRRPDIDVLRVGAFFLLIAYHIGMFYVPGGWHVKSTHILPQLELPMGLLNPWRLTLLFLISGVATRFMGEKLAPRTFAAKRSSRLLIPLLFGILIVVPPQSWAEVVEKNGYTGNFFDFWVRYLSFDQSFGIILPTYNHLWFVAYLWAYTIVSIIFWRLLPKLDRISERALTGFGLFVLPVALFGLYRATLFPIWGENQILWEDAYAHAHYATAFVIGLLLAKQDAAWSLLAKSRHITLFAIPLTLAVALPLSDSWEEQPGWRGFVFAFIREGYAWIVICMLIGYAHQHIRSGSPLLTTLAEAVFPFYIIHQTTIVLVGHYLSPYRLPLVSEAVIIFSATVASCAAAYWVARNIPFMRLPFGLRPQQVPE